MSAAFENVWESRVEWVEIVKRCLVVRLADGENIEVAMERKKGKYLKSLKGWLLDHRNLRLHLHPGSRWHGWRRGVSEGLGASQDNGRVQWCDWNHAHLPFLLSAGKRGPPRRSGVARSPGLARLKKTGLMGGRGRRLVT